LKCALDAASVANFIDESNVEKLYMTKVEFATGQQGPEMDDDLDRIFIAVVACLASEWN